MRTPYFLLFFSIFALTSLSAQAQLADGDFSNGFIGWSPLGTPTIDTSNVPSDASQAALIQSTNSIATSPYGDPGPVNSADADTITDINSKLGTSIPLVGTADSGQGIYQTLTLSAPTVVTFETSFASYDSSSIDSTDDSAGYVLNGNYVQLYTSPLSLADTTPTSYASQSVLLPAGADTFGFVVYNTYDNTFDSEMWVTDVALVPEPSMWLLVAVSLGMIAGLRRLALRPLRIRAK